MRKNVQYFGIVEYFLILGVMFKNALKEQEYVIFEK